MRDTRPILDATQGNRMMWANKNPPNVVFMDKEANLKYKPDVISTWDSIPFPDNHFSLVIFDPPHVTHENHPFKNKSGCHDGWYGYFNSKEECVSEISKAQKEFSRVSNRLCFKWDEKYIPLEEMILLFNEWIEINRYKCKPRTVKTNFGNGVIKNIYHKNSGRSYWITFTRKD